MDIVERLRGDYSDERLEIAADEIERLREALHQIADAFDVWEEKILSAYEELCVALEGNE